MCVVCSGIRAFPERSAPVPLEPCSQGTVCSFQSLSGVAHPLYQVQLQALGNPRGVSVSVAEGAPSPTPQVQGHELTARGCFVVPMPRDQGWVGRGELLSLVGRSRLSLLHLGLSKQSFGFVCL